MGNCDCVAPLHRAMKLRKDLLATSAETFNRSSSISIQKEFCFENQAYRDPSSICRQCCELMEPDWCFPDPDPIFQISPDLPNRATARHPEGVPATGIFYFLNKGIWTSFSIKKCLDWQVFFYIWTDPETVFRIQPSQKIQDRVYGSSILLAAMRRIKDLGKDQAATNRYSSSKINSSMFVIRSSDPGK